MIFTPEQKVTLEAYWNSPDEFRRLVEVFADDVQERDWAAGEGLRWLVTIRQRPHTEQSRSVYWYTSRWPERFWFETNDSFRNWLTFDFQLDGNPLPSAYRPAAVSLFERAVTRYTELTPERRTELWRLAQAALEGVTR